MTMFTDLPQRRHCINDRCSDRAGTSIGTVNAMLVDAEVEPNIEGGLLVAGC